MSESESLRRKMKAFWNLHLTIIQKVVNFYRNFSKHVTEALYNYNFVKLR